MLVLSSVVSKRQKRRGSLSGVAGLSKAIAGDATSILEIG
jgi:hypothetical protein